MKVIDYKETMKCLDEVEDCEDKTYAKSLLEWAINKRTFEAVPLSVIEDIKAEIKAKSQPRYDTALKLYYSEKVDVLEIIDRKVNEVTKNVSEL